MFDRSLFLSQKGATPFFSPRGKWVVAFLAVVLLTAVLLGGCSYQRYQVPSVGGSRSDGIKVSYDNTIFRVQKEINLLVYILLVPTILGPEAYRNHVESHSTVVDFHACLTTKAAERDYANTGLSKKNSGNRMEIRVFRSNYNKKNERLELGITGTLYSASGIVLTRAYGKAEEYVPNNQWHQVGNVVDRALDQFEEKLEANAAGIEKTQRIVDLSHGESQELLSKASRDRFEKQFGQKNAVRHYPRNAPAFNPDRTFAVIIGISSYVNSDINLRFARNDAERFFDALVNPANSLAIPPENVALLIDQNAGAARIRSALNAFLDTENAENVIIFWAGHGGVDMAMDENVPDGIQKYLLPHDVNLEGHLGQSAISMSEIATYLRKKRIKKVFMALDTCYSGATGEMMMNTRSLGIRVDPTAKVFRAFKDAECRVLLAACKANQTAKELPQYSAGLFSHFLVQAMTSQSADSNRDGFSDVSEIINYVSSNVGSTATELGFKQDPIIRISEASHLNVALCALDR